MDVEFYLQINTDNQCFKFKHRLVNFVFIIKKKGLNGKTFPILKYHQSVYCFWLNFPTMETP